MAPPGGLGSNALQGGLGSSALPLTGHGSSTSGPAPTGWDADALAPVEKALAGVLGPMARVMVRQAARQTRDLASLRDALARQITDDADRVRFLARLEAGTTHLTKSAVGAASASGTSAVRSGEEALSEALKAHATKVLTTHMGPIAKILVKKALAQQPGPARFVELLADMADGADRARLLRELQAPH